MIIITLKKKKRRKRQIRLKQYTTDRTTSVIERAESETIAHFWFKKTVQRSELSGEATTSIKYLNNIK